MRRGRIPVVAVLHYGFGYEDCRAATRARPPYIHTLLRALHPVGLNRGTEDPLVHREGVAIDAKRAVRVAHLFGTSTKNIETRVNGRIFSVFLL